MRKLTAIGVTIAASSLLLSAPAARADLIIQASLDGTNFTVEADVPTSPILGFNFTIGSFEVQGIEARSNGQAIPLSRI